MTIINVCWIITISTESDHALVINRKCCSVHQLNKVIRKIFGTSVGLQSVLKAHYFPSQSVQGWPNEINQNSESCVKLKLKIKFQFNWTKTYGRNSQKSINFEYKFFFIFLRETKQHFTFRLKSYTQKYIL